MPGSISFEAADAAGVARITLANAAKLNAIDIAMWRELRALFERLQALPLEQAPRALIVCGADGQFASGGDIAEFAAFRFDAETLRDFHENTVAPALHARLRHPAARPDRRRVHRRRAGGRGVLRHPRLRRGQPLRRADRQARLSDGAR
jgi:enoyl-CoA hydratase/carnithine racemase